MSIRSLVKQCVPPIIVNALHREGDSFDGLYETFAETGLPTATNFVTPAGMDWSRKKRRESLERHDRKTDTQALQPGDLFLAGVISGVAAITPVHVYDIGGGLGQTYFSLARLLTPHVLCKLQWTVIEQSAFCAKPAFAPVRIVSAFPDMEPVQFRVGVMRTALQYFENWRMPLDQFIQHDMDMIVLIRLLAGDIPRDFVTVEHSADTSNPTPIKAVSLTHLRQHFNENGYRECFLCADKEEYTMETFPADLRIPHALATAFAKQ